MNKKDYILEENEFVNVQIYSKYDYELSNSEIKKIFKVYNECFYENRIINKKITKTVCDLLSKKNCFKWYIAKIGSEVVGISNFVYNYPENAFGLAINRQKGENITSVGVLTKYRKLGIATLLMERIIKENNEKCDLVVEIISSNKFFQALINLYESLGFEEVDEFVNDNEVKDNKNSDLISNDIKQANYYFILYKNKTCNNKILTRK